MDELWLLGVQGVDRPGNLRQHAHAVVQRNVALAKAVAQAPSAKMGHRVIEVALDGTRAANGHHAAAGSVACQAELAAESLDGRRLIPTDRVDDLEYLLAVDALVPDQGQPAHSAPGQFVDQLRAFGHHLGGECPPLLAIVCRPSLHDRIAQRREPLGQRGE